METLEDRRVLAAVTVTAFNDVVNGDTSSISALVANAGQDGVSLREAVLAANATAGSDTITFNGPGTVVLAGSALPLTGSDTTVIDGGGQVTVDAGNQSTAFVIDTGADAVLQGLTVTGGSSVSNGGGVHNSGTLEIRSSTISGNAAGAFGFGGGVFNEGNLTLVESLVTGNTAGNGGGGLANLGTMDISDSTVSSNYAFYGGGISNGSTNFAGTLSISGSTISGNSAHLNGAGIFNGTGTVEIDGTTISGNDTTAINLTTGGGGIFTNDALIVTASTISGNSAHLGGGLAINSEHADAVVVNSTLSGNTATLHGGGVEVSLIGNLVMTNSTVFGNAGGGVRANGNTTLNNTVIARSTGRNDLVVAASATVTGTTNLIEDGLSTSGLTGTLTGDPRLLPLADNGGPTLTHMPLTDSPLVNAGTSSLAVGPDGTALLYDQRGPGFIRTLSGVEIGAVEGQDPEGLVVTTGADVVAFDGLLSLREAVLRANASDGGPQTITFAHQINTVTKSGLPIQVDDPDAGDVVVIDGGGRVTITGTLPNAALAVSAGSTAEFRGLKITSSINHGTAGGILNLGTLTVAETSVFGIRGIGVLNTGTLELTRSTVSGNSTTNQVAAGLFNSGTMTITNSTISGNSGVIAGGVFSTSILNLSNSTVFGNTGGSVGGVFSDTGDNPQLNLNSTILAGNTGGDLLTNGATLTGANNLIQDGSEAGSFANTIVADPLLGPLQDNGGPTLTHLPSPLSPVEEQGSNPLALTSDQRGSAFPRAAGPLGSGPVDIGAVEVPDLDPAGLEVTTTLDVVADDGVLSLREAVLRANASNVGPETITFADALGEATITLGISDLTLTDSEPILIDGGGDITVSGGGQFRVFQISSGAAVELVDLTITGGNSGSGFGGGVLNGGTLALTKTTISGNQGFRGGGVSNSGNLDVKDSSISGNAASSRGGGIFNTGFLRVVGSTISGNTTPGPGGGLYQGFGGSGYSVLVNSTVSGNFAHVGGGVDNNGRSYLFNSTVANNIASSGAGVNNFSHLTMDNSVVAGNSGGDLRNSGGNLFGSNNLIQDGSSSAAFAGTLTGDPLLGPLSDNGGPTLTHLPMRGSPLIDAGRNDRVARDIFDRDGDNNTIEPDPFDQRSAGFLRFVGPIVDIGAVEVTFDAVDDAPTVDEDAGPYTLDVLANDQDPDDSAQITAINNVQPATANVTFTSSAVTVEVPADFSGEVTFTYSATSAVYGADTGTVTLTVAPVNDAPIAADDSATAIGGQPVTINVRANDTDVDGDTLTITAVTDPAKGTAEIVNGQIVYTPERFFGGDTFVYTVEDGNGGSATATVTVGVAIQTVSFLEGINGYDGTHDADPNENSPNAIRNGDQVLVDGDVDIAPGDGLAGHGVLRFDHIIGSGPGQIPQGATVVSATLTLTIFDEGDVVILHELTVPFDEATVTWNSLGGGIIPGVNATDAIWTFAGSAQQASSDIRDVDVSSSVQSWVNGGPATNFGWGFTPLIAPDLPNSDGTNGVDWHSSEAAVSVRPLLTVEFEGNFGTETVAFRNGVNGYNGTQDADPSEVLPNNVRNRTSMTIDGELADTPPLQSHGLLRFDDIIGDEAGRIPQGSEVISATLGLIIDNVGGDVSLHELTVPFDEQTVTWNNVGGGVIPGVNATNPIQSFEGSPSSELGNVRRVDVTSSLQSWVDGGSATNFGWGFTPFENNGNGTSWGASDGGFGVRPFLKVEFRERNDNDTPVANDDTASTDENTGISIDVLANDTDLDLDDTPANFSLDSLDSVTVSGLSTGPTLPAGVVTISGNQVLFTPGTTFDELDDADTATVTIDYTMSDDEGATSAATLVLTVGGLDDPLVANDDTASTDENTAISIDVLANDTDADLGASQVNLSLDSLDSVTVSGLSTGPTLPAGVVTISSNQVLFTPGTTFDELDSSDTATVTIGYTMSDDEGATSSATLVLTVGGLNDAPMASDGGGTTDENTTISIDVLANDTDADSGDSLANFSLDSLDSVTVSGLSIDPTLPPGVVTISGNRVLFTPGTTFGELEGSDTAIVTIDYTMSDDEGATSSATLVLTVIRLNDPPVANDDTASTDENTPISIDVLANDTDQDFDDTPANFSLDSLDSVTVSGLSTGPTLPAGVVTISSNQVLFAPGTTFDELDSSDTATVTIGYTMSDKEGFTSSATLVLTVGGLNDAPVANDDTASTDENTPISIDVLANDTDLDSDDSPAGFSLDSLDSVTVSGLSTGPTLPAGVVTISGSQVLFTPGTTFDELDSSDTATVTIGYTMSDDEGAISSATLVLTVGGQNDAPVANNDTAQTVENDFIWIDVLANDTDADRGDSPADFSLNSLDSVTVGGLGGLNIDPTLAASLVTINRFNQVVFAPGTTFDELDGLSAVTVTIDYTMSDDEGATSSATLVLTVFGLNDSPVANDDTASTDENTDISIDVLANDTDVDRGDSAANFSLDSLDSVTVSGLSTGPTLPAGVVTISGNQVLFTPGTTFDELDGSSTATVTIGYTMSDAQDASSSATLVLTVGGLNDAPVLTSPETQDVQENTQAVLTLAATDADLPGQMVTFTVAGMGADNSLFEIVSGNELQFIAAPDFEKPADLGGTPGDNIYEVTVQASDGNGGITEQTIQVTVTDVEEIPSVESVVIGDGSAQRSMIRSLTVTFDTEVTIDSGAFSLAQTLGGNASNFTIADADMTASVVNGKTVVVLTFENSTTGIIGGSLADGNYTLQIDREKIRVGSAAMSANHVDEFFRFFGDRDGDGDVDAADFRHFRRTYRQGSSDPAFDDAFDFDGDNDVDAADFRHFRARYRTRLGD